MTSFPGPPAGSGEERAPAVAGASPSLPLDEAELAARRARLPDPRLVASWFGLAHLALLLAALVVAADPGLLAATFYHPRLLAAAHLLTVGWISGSILGALHLVPAMALRARVRRHAGDLAACAAFAAGTAALVAGLWLRHRHGVWAGAGLTLVAAGWVAARTLPPILRAPVALPVRGAFALAFGGLAAAALLGALRAAGAGGPPPALAHLGATFAHAHLAALGWAFLVVLGAGYRLLPMLLPAAMPPARRVALATGAAALGALVLPAGLLLSHRGAVIGGGALALAGAALLLRDATWMLRHRRPVPPARPRPDLPLAHVAAALLALAAAGACGVAILAQRGAAPPGLRSAYGLLALLGFFGQLIAGVAQRLVGWTAWLHAYAGAGFARLPPTPYAFLPRSAQRVALAGWLAAVPALALGAGLGSPGLVRGGALALLAGVAAGGAALCAAAVRARGARG